MCASDPDATVPHIFDQSLLDRGVAEIFFFHRIAIPPQPHESSDVDKRRLSQMAV